MNLELFNDLLRTYTYTIGGVPDYDSFEFWYDEHVEKTEEGLSRRESIEEILTVSSSLFGEIESGKSDELFLNSLYDYLGKEADEAGLEFWMNQVENGVSRAEISSYFLFEIGAPFSIMGA